MESNAPVEPGYKGMWGIRNWSAARWREYGFRLALELVVVFVGVYAASAFQERQKAREDEARRHQIRQALIREIEAITEKTRSAAFQVNQGLGQYQKAFEQKQYPPIQPFLEPYRIQTHMWEATLQSGALDLFDVQTVYSLSEFYNELNDGFALVAQLRELSERMLIPAADAPPSEFYDLTTGRPRGKYMWYFTGMKNLGQVATYITEQGERLLAELRREGEGDVVVDTANTNGLN